MSDSGGARVSGSWLLQGLIFDFDGLIVDTESAIYLAWRELYLSQGHDLVLSKYVNCVGSTFGHYDPMAELEVLTGGPVAWEHLLPVKDQRIRDLQVPLDTMPGIRELLAEAREEGVSCAIASSSSRTHVQGWLERTGLEEWFQVIRTRDDVMHPKPAPDLFLSALHGLGMTPDQVLILEDSANGLAAARAAGIRCVNVPSPVTRGSDFSGAVAILDSLAGIRLRELDAILSQTPPAGQFRPP